MTFFFAGIIFYNPIINKKKPYITFLWWNREVSMNENIGFKQLFSVIKEKMVPSDPDCPDRNGHFSLLSVLCLDSCISGNHSNSCS